MDIDLLVKNFQIFLVSSFESWRNSLPESLNEAENEFSDWAQANWELLVERPFCRPGEFLEIYGSGSDYEEEGHSRVFFHKESPTHVVACEAKQKSKIRDVLNEKDIDPSTYDFEEFVSLSGGWHYSKPPFDHVLLTKNDIQAVIPMSELYFTVRLVNKVA